METEESSLVVNCAMRSCASSNLRLRLSPDIDGCTPRAGLECRQCFWHGVSFDLGSASILDVPRFVRGLKGGCFSVATASTQDRTSARKPPLGHFSAFRRKNAGEGVVAVSGRHRYHDTDGAAPPFVEGKGSCTRESALSRRAPFPRRTSIFASLRRDLKAALNVKEGKGRVLRAFVACVRSGES